jgi:hypothetical protein
MSDEPKIERSGNKLIVDGVEYIPRNIMLERVAAKQTKLDEAVRQRDEARTLAEEAKAAAAGVDALRAEYDQYRSGIEQSAAFRAVGLDGDEHEQVRARLLRFHGADLAELGDDDERPTLAAWLDAQRADPVIGHLLPASPDSTGDLPPAADAVASDRGSVASASARVAPRVGGGREPAPQRRMSMQQLQAEHRKLLATAGQIRDPGEKAKAYEAARELLASHRRG